MSSKWRMLKTLLKANVACGCGRSKLPDVYEPKPRPPPPPRTRTKTETEIRNMPVSPRNVKYNIPIKTPPRNITSINESVPATTTKALTSKIKATSVAVVKNSTNPYHDFKHSMLQIIFENEMQSKRELQVLLHCYLELNEPCHHDVIVKAFIEIWNSIMSKKPGVGGGFITA